MILNPCIKYETNSPLKQCWHIAGEVKEVVWELLRGRPELAAIEAVDVIISCVTLLHILGYGEQDRYFLSEVVDMKNKSREYQRRDRIER